MPGNTQPLYSKVADIQSPGEIVGPTANTAQDGTSSATSMDQVWQADATNGGFLEKIRLKAAGSPAATVARVFLCSVTGAFTMGTTNTVVNTWLIAEKGLLAVTLSQTLGQVDVDIPINMAIPPGYRVLIAFGTSTGAAGTGYVATGIGGKF